MKTAVSIPDDVFADAERLARRLKKSRSQLYSHALREYVSRHSSDDVTEALDKVYSGESSDDRGFARSAARRRLRRVEW
jgi:metal-responsive CopG/Arc/MetJ family transcriptional regulator